MSPFRLFKTPNYCVMESVNPEGMSETISNGDNNSEKGNSCSEHDSGSGNSMISVPNAKLNPNNSGELWEVKYGKVCLIQEVYRINIEWYME